MSKSKSNSDAELYTVLADAEIIEIAGVLRRLKAVRTFYIEQVITPNFKQETGRGFLFLENHELN